MPHVTRSPMSLPIQKKIRLSQHVQFEPIIQFRFRILMACCHVADISMFQILMAHCHVAEFPCSCSWTALLAVGSWKIFPVAVPGNTLLQERQFSSCWSWMARLAIITSRKWSGWHVVMHAVDVRSAAGLSAKDSCRRRASWRTQVRQWSVVYGLWYKKTIRRSNGWCLKERLWNPEEEQKISP